MEVGTHRSEVQGALHQQEQGRRVPAGPGADRARLLAGRWR